MFLDRLKTIQIIVLVLVGCLLIEYALWVAWKPKPLLIAAAAAITSYLSLLWAIFKNSPEGWIQAGFRYVFRLVLSSLKRAICTLVVCLTGVVVLGLLLFSTWRAETIANKKKAAEPNYLVQLFFSDAVNPAVGAVVTLNDPFSSSTVEKTTDTRGHALFRLDNGVLRQISIAVSEDRTKRVAVLPVERIESLPNSKPIDIDSISSWKEVASTDPQPVEFATAVKESIEQYVKSFGSDTDIRGEHGFLSLHLPFGLPKATMIVSRQQYVVGFDPSRHIPRWVAYRMNVGTTRYQRASRDTFKPDPLIPENAQAPSEAYANNPYDRGQLVSRLDVGGYGEDPQYIVSYMSVVAPQINALNQGVWSTLEQYGRKQSETADIWIISGPAFVPEAGGRNIAYALIGDGVAVPTHFFRIIARKTSVSPVEILAFLVPNTTNVSGSLDQFLTSIDSIEEITGLDLFDALSLQDQERLESSMNHLW